jgi:hypothetical protein
MTTPMISNLKKLQDQVTGSDPEDPTLYRQIIGSFMHLVHTRPDICYAVNALSQFMCEPKHIHMVAIKHILRYVRGPIAYGLRYTSSGGVMLHGFTDSAWMGSTVDRKSTSRYCFSLGSTMISCVKFKAAARAILREDGKDPSQDLGPPVHSWGSWSGTKQ